MSKKIVSLFLSLVMVFSLVSSVFAEEQSKGTNTLSFEQVQRLKEIEKKYGGDVEILFPESSESKSFSSKSSIPSERLKFNSVEDFDAFIHALKAADQQTNNKEMKFGINGTSPMYTGHVDWYALLIGGTFSWKNIDYKYEVEFDVNGKGYMSKIYDVKSYLTGVQVGLSYTQTQDRSWPSGGTAHLVVDGQYLVGAEIGGVPVGAKVNTTWENTDTKSMPVQA